MDSWPELSGAKTLMNVSQLSVCLSLCPSVPLSLCLSVCRTVRASVKRLLRHGQRGGVFLKHENTLVRVCVCMWSV